MNTEKYRKIGLEVGIESLAKFVDVSSRVFVIFIVVVCQYLWRIALADFRGRIIYYPEAQRGCDFSSLAIVLSLRDTCEIFKSLSRIKTARFRYG